ncbi:hypothetical protein CC80DRAFT_240183 [Byssothecium circinans]|uniref:Uncharacterized protein n=1 Tax=Byssothecium circinans TaxID=147558 RepID=A0A6A5TF15_9PLEO|nr:hypothetical protein CC80DRAFT_240183 [Byssothecium circinans]
MTPISRPTGSVARRQETNSAGLTTCEPYTVIQGPETYQFQMTDPKPGQWVIDQKCNWKGDIQKADLTCSLVQSGAVPKSLDMEVNEKLTIPASDLITDLRTPFVAVAVVTGSSATSSGSTLVTASSSPPSASGNTSAGFSGGASSSPAVNNFAAAGSLPIGAMAFFVGAAGVFAVALAL